MTSGGRQKHKKKSLHSPFLKPDSTFWRCTLFSSPCRLATAMPRDFSLASVSFNLSCEQKKRACHAAMPGRQTCMMQFEDISQQTMSRRCTPHLEIHERQRALCVERMHRAPECIDPVPGVYLDVQVPQSGRHGGGHVGVGKPSRRRCRPAGALDGAPAPAPLRLTASAKEALLRLKSRGNDSPKATCVASCALCFAAIWMYSK